MKTIKFSLFHSQARLISIVVFTAAVALALAVYYRREPILEFHGFRQTQTAITAYWMLHDGWQVNYQTPVGGYPWSIPFEFPVYQSIVALIAFLMNFPLDPTGRFVSLFFLFASALPAFSVRRRLGLPQEVPWVFSALLWSSPIYLFWGRTFMIETTATFFTFASIPYAIDLIDEKPQWRSILLFILWATLGMLQKITTALPVMIIFSLLIAIVHLKTSGLHLPSWQKTWMVLLAFTVPLLIAGLWLYYSEIMREQNILGIELTSKALPTWNFGTLEQRLNVQILKTIVFDRVFARNLAGLIGVLILGMSLFLSGRRIRVFVLISLILFLLPIEMFIGLNLVHDYYQVSSALFLICGFSIAVVDLIRKTIWEDKNRAIAVVTLALVIFNLSSYGQTYWVLVDNMERSLNRSSTQTLLVSSLLKKYTPPNSAIVVFGMDWNSEIAYYSERKSFTVPTWETRPDWPGKPDWQRKYHEIWRNPEPFLGGKELGAIIFCEGNDGRFDLEDIFQNPLVQHQPRLLRVNDCYIWLPGEESDAILKYDP